MKRSRCEKICWRAFGLGIFAIAYLGLPSMTKPVHAQDATTIANAPAAEVQQADAWYEDYRFRSGDLPQSAGVAGEPP
jgi:hypothetical protein